MENLRELHNIELPRARGAYLDEAPACIWTEPGWVLEVKEDGTRESLQIGELGSLLVGRNREGFLKGVENAGSFMVHKHPVFSHIACAELASTILDGELTMHFTQDGDYDETTKVRRREGKFAGYTVWQCLFWKGKDVRELPDAERRKLAEEAVSLLNNPLIRLIERFPATREKLQEIWDAGEEGAVAKLETASLKIGQRTCTHWWKLKSQQTVDAFVTGVTEGKSGGSGVKGVKPQKNGTAASLTLSMLDARGKIITVAKVKHLPDSIVQDGFKNFAAYKHRVMEMRVSGWNGKAFRWARFIRGREDKRPFDCRFAEQIGETSHAS